MKIRLGFVSNSSSSSFVICGIDFANREELLGAVKDLDPTFYDKNKEDLEETDCMYSLGDMLEGAFGDAGLRIKTYEWGNEFTLGVEDDPENFSVNDCINGFVTEEQHKMLTKIAEHTGKQISVGGGTEYC
ncbi:hypothetical protein VPHD479_0127 [Vibrio phage D479]